MKKILNICLSFIAISLITTATIAVEVPIVRFSLNNYDQDISKNIDPNDQDYNKPLMTVADQKSRTKEFYNHYFATDNNESISPWDSNTVTKQLLSEQFKDKISEQKLIDKYGNYDKKDSKKIGYGENFYPYQEQWIKNIINNMNLAQFDTPIKYNPKNRGITTEDLQARVLPTIDPYFYDFSLAGEGYPFDNLQESAIWVGTPIYIIGQTLNNQWYLVLTPHFTAWVPSKGIARTNENFIKKWQEHANRTMVAVIHTDLSVYDANKQYLFNTHVGAIFPGTGNIDDSTIEVLIPIVDTKQNARIAISKLSKEDATSIPLSATPNNFSKIISTLIGRPYGWGGMYFYNDCSQELQSLYTPFGIWLPRNSASQMQAGKTVIDKSSLGIDERLNYLKQHGKKFTTIIYVDGHVMLYIGNNSITNNPITYQNTWGLKSKDKSYRAVIGRAIFLPLLSSYPEDYNLTSWAGRQFFKLTYLDDNTKNTQHEEL
jgi:cell wall-associated NlpC family hydrolase